MINDKELVELNADYSKMVYHEYESKRILLKMAVANQKRIRTQHRIMVEYYRHKKELNLLDQIDVPKLLSDIQDVKTSSVYMSQTINKLQTIVSHVKKVKNDLWVNPINSFAHVSEYINRYEYNYLRPQPIAIK